jgi:hypothetical protein
MNCRNFCLADLLQLGSDPALSSLPPRDGCSFSSTQNIALGRCEGFDIFKNGAALCALPMLASQLEQRS